MSVASKHAPLMIDLAAAADDDARTRVRSRDRLVELTGRFRIGSLVTRSPEGHLHARPMTVALFDPSAEELGFLTVTDSDVVRDVARDPMVSVVFQDARHHVGWSGRAHVDHERYRVARCWRSEMARWFPDGPDDPRLVLLVVRAMRAEYWSASVVSSVLRAMGAPSGTPPEHHASPMRHGVVVFDDDAAQPCDW